MYAPVRALLACLVLAGACGGDDDGGADGAGDGDGGGGAEWQVVASDLPQSLLSVWGSSENDVWVVGGDGADGAGPAVFHWDGAAWTRMETGITDNTDLWWVFGFADGPVFLGGEKGTILRYQDGAFEQLETPGPQTVFGLWGASPDDVWAVGGNLTGGGFAWRFDGAAWSAVAEVPEEITGPGTIWKVAGAAADNVWMSATGGLTLHWNGELLVEGTDSDASLFSISGNDERFITVGGAFDGVIYENEGDGWNSALEPGGSELLSGVVVRDDQAYAVGHFGTILRRGAEGWTPEEGGDQLSQENLHATWIDPAGGVWVVGGQFDAPRTTAGVLLHKGTPIQGNLP
ncbi:MAG TPA: hypothetical protein VKB80_12140 [Kofleriaceae bacterium]|nr:hypothetical protein [Kofleriaceae bacterium]